LKTWKDLSWDFFEGLFFVCIVMEILIVPIGVVVGWTDGDVVHWFLWTVNAAVFVTLTGIWIEVKKDPREGCGRASRDWRTRASGKYNGERTVGSDSRIGSRELLHSARLCLRERERTCPGRDHAESPPLHCAENARLGPILA
jgi:hypothetical protein